MSTVEIIRSVDRLRALADAWNALSAACRTPVLDHDWLLSCAETFHDDGDLRIATMRAAGAVAGIAPLALESTESGNRLVLLGASRLHEPGGWLCSTEASVAGVLDPVLKLGYPLLLQRIPEQTPICQAIGRLTRGRAIAIRRKAAPSLAVDTRGSWDAYHATLSSQITENLPRVRRKAERALGRMEFRDLTPAPSDLDALLETVVAVEASGWKGRQGSSLRDRRDLLEFFRRYGARAAAQGRLRVAMLTFGDAVAAIELAVEAYRRRWQLKIGYHEALSSYYPGLLLTEASIRAAFDRGLEGYEFLGSAEPWEERWRPGSHPYWLLAVYPFSARSVVGACRDLGGTVRKRAQLVAARLGGRA